MTVTPNTDTIGDFDNDFRPIPGFEEYEINRAGEVYSTLSDRFMSTKQKSGRQVKMYLMGKRHTRSVAQLIDEAFPEYVEAPVPTDAQKVLDYVKEVIGVDLDRWQKYRLERWIAEAIKKEG